MSVMVFDANPTCVPDIVSDFSLPRISFPFSVFLDSFGLYRNAYHSLKGM